jgi:hypothetical protein
VAMVSSYTSDHPPDAVLAQASQAGGPRVDTIFHPGGLPPRVSFVLSLLFSLPQPPLGRRLGLSSELLETLLSSPISPTASVRTALGLKVGKLRDL